MVQMHTGGALAAEARVLKEVGQALAELEGMNLSELRDRYLELFGEVARSKNLPFLRKKLAFRIQERVEGGLSARALAQIEALGPEELPAKKAREKRQRAPRSSKRVSDPKAPARDPRLPQIGTVLLREHGGVAHEVTVLETGFHYRGRQYKSLSTLAKEITGTAWNGFLFFGLMTRKASHGR